MPRLLLLRRQHTPVITGQNLIVIALRRDAQDVFVDKLDAEISANIHGNAGHLLLRQVGGKAVLVSIVDIHPNIRNLSVSGFLQCGLNGGALIIFVLLLAPHGQNAGIPGIILPGAQKGVQKFHVCNVPLVKGHILVGLHCGKEGLQIPLPVGLRSFLIGIQLIEKLIGKLPAVLIAALIHQVKQKVTGLHKLPLLNQVERLLINGFVSCRFHVFQLLGAVLIVAKLGKDFLGLTEFSLFQARKAHGIFCGKHLLGAVFIIFQGLKGLNGLLILSGLRQRRSIAVCRPVLEKA